MEKRLERLEVRVDANSGDLKRLEAKVDANSSDLKETIGSLRVIKNFIGSGRFSISQKTLDKNKS